MARLLLLGTAAVAAVEGEGEPPEPPGTVVVGVEGAHLGTVAGALDPGTVEEELPGTEPAEGLVPGTVVEGPDLGTVVVAGVAATALAGQEEGDVRPGTGPGEPQAADTVEG